MADIRMTEEQLATVTAAAAKAGAEAAIAALGAQGGPPAPQTEEGRHQSYRRWLLNKETPAAVVVAPKFLRVRSPVTQATFEIKVVASRSDVEGRILDVIHYRHPDGWQGQRPEGMEYSVKGYVTQEFKRWAADTFFLTDLRAWVNLGLSKARARGLTLLGDATDEPSTPPPSPMYPEAHEQPPPAQPDPTALVGEMT